MSSTRDGRFQRSLANTQDEFTFELDGEWTLPGDWSVSVIETILPELDDEQTTGDIMVYTDAVEYSVVGHGMYPLIDRVVYRGSSTSRCQTSFHPFKRKMKSVRYEHLLFKLSDARGVPPVWIDTSHPTYLCLEFTPEKSGFETREMDLTFLSNQSTDVYPENHPNKFTAVLPYQQQLEEVDRWRIGTTKITLPSAETSSIMTEWTIDFVPNIPLPYDAKTSTTVGPVNTFQALMDDYNNKLKTLVSSWFPKNPTGAGLVTEDKENYIQLYLRNSKVPEVVHFYGPVTVIDVMRTIQIKSDNTILLGVNKQTRKFMFYCWDESRVGLDALTQRMGFTKLSLQTPRIILGGPLPLCKLYDADNLPFEGDAKTLYDFMMVGSMIYETFTPLSPHDEVTHQYALGSGFFMNPHSKRPIEVTLTMPEALYDLLSLEKSMLIPEVRDGNRYLSTTIKPWFNFPHHEPVSSLPGWESLDVCYWVTQPIKKVPCSSKDSGQLESVTTTNLDSLNKLAHVTCSLIEPQRVGQKSMPLLDIVSMSSSVQGGRAQPKQYIYEPHRIKWQPLKTSLLHEITFEIEDEEGKAIPFSRGGVVTVTVRLQKQ